MCLDFAFCVFNVNKKSLAIFFLERFAAFFFSILKFRRRKIFGAKKRQQKEAKKEKRLLKRALNEKSPSKSNKNAKNNEKKRSIKEKTMAKADGKFIKFSKK